MQIPTRYRAVFGGLLFWCTTILIQGTPIDVLPATMEGALQPQVAVGEDGTVFIAFGKGEEIYVTASVNLSGPFQAPQRVGRLPKLALGMRRGPRIAISGQAVTVIAANNSDLFSYRSDDAGRTWSAAVRINNVVSSAREGL